MASCERGSSQRDGARPDPPAEFGRSLRLRERVTAGRYVLQLWPSRLYGLPVALFTFLWLRFVWRWYALLLLGSHLGPAEQSRSFFVLFGLPFVMAGLSLLATSARLCLGRTVISVDAQRFRVTNDLFRGLLRWHSPLTLPTLAIRDFVAETSARLDDEDQELDVWQVTLRLKDGCAAALPLPVRTLVEADAVVLRLNRALQRVRTPLGYRDGVGTPSSDGKASPLGASTT